MDLVGSESSEGNRSAWTTFVSATRSGLRKSTCKEMIISDYQFYQPYFGSVDLPNLWYFSRNWHKISNIGKISKNQQPTRVLSAQGVKNRQFCHNCRLNRQTGNYDWYMNMVRIWEPFFIETANFILKY